jgi:hypothetical protein
LNGEMVLDTDASDEQLGCCLQQRGDDGHLHPLGYWSRQLNPAEVNYSATEKEALAVVWSIKRLRPYLEGQKFIVRTDHAALTWLLSVDGENRRLARWRLCLAEYDFIVKYRPGVQNQPADGPSRIVTSGHDCEELENDVPCVLVKHEEEDFEPIDCEQLMKEQQSDDYCQSILQMMVEIETEYSVDDRGLIVRLDPKTGRTQIYIPESLRERIMTLGHYPQIAGHPGGTIMYQNLRRELFWPRMAIDIHQFVHNCASCARKRLVTQRKKPM